MFLVITVLKQSNLENNNSTFKDAFDKPISGVAMGTIFAQTCATLTMGSLEVRLYDICKVKLRSLL